MTAVTSVPVETAVSQRLRIAVTGRVQGVGFRPFVHRLAADEGLGGLVYNTSDGALIEIEGPARSIERFLKRLDAEVRPPALIESRGLWPVSPRGSKTFEIGSSVV